MTTIDELISDILRRDRKVRQRHQDRRSTVIAAVVVVMAGAALLWILR